MARKRKRKAKSTMKLLGEVIAAAPKAKPKPNKPTSPTQKSKPSGSTAVMIFCIILFFMLFSKCGGSKNKAPKEIDRTIIATETATEPPTEAPTEPPTEPQTEAPTDPPTEAQPVPVPAPQPQVIHFIVNTDSGCIHARAGCSAAEAIAADHRAEIDIPENEIPNYAGTYWACGKCSSHYSAQLPKP